MKEKWIEPKLEELNVKNTEAGVYNGPEAAAGYVSVPPAPTS